MRMYILECGGLLGLPLIQWLRQHSDAVLLGSDQHHERVDALLKVHGFSYYAMDPAREPEQLKQLISDVDVVIDLSSIERREVASDRVDFPGELQVLENLVRNCIEAQARLVHVSSSQVYGKSMDVTPVPVLAGTRGAVREEEAMPSDEPDASNGGHVHRERVLQDLIHAHGTTGELDHVLARVFSMIGSELRSLPIQRTPTLLDRLRDSLITGDTEVLPVLPADQAVQSFVTVDDVAECLGRIALAPIGSLAGTIINVGNPAIRTSMLKIASEVLSQYQEERGLTPAQLPRLPVLDAAVQSELRAPSIERVTRLIGWEPHDSMSDLIRVAMSGLPPR